MPRPEPWQPIHPRVNITPEVLREMLFEGQAFRWQETQPHVWRGYWKRYAVEVCSLNGQLHARAFDKHACPPPAELADYFDAHSDYEALTNALPWRSDPVLAQALRLYPQLRILKQDAEETLLIFLLSSNKRIVQIKRVLEALALRYGESLGNPELPNALPSWERLAGVDHEGLRATGMGYRAAHVAGSAAFLREHPNFLRTVAALPYSQARTELMRLPGVGEKIADCVLLYGMNKRESFPVDTWVAQAMQTLYGLDGWTLPQIAHFGRTHFGAEAGVAQQALFTAKRRGLL